MLRVLLSRRCREKNYPLIHLRFLVGSRKYVDNTRHLGVPISNPRPRLGTKGQTSVGSAWRVGL